MKVKEVADLAGVSVRTLHHYDHIGLLKPSTNESGYRIYTRDDLEILQQILFFRELDFPLQKIKDIINRPTFDRMEALELHRGMLLKKRIRIDQMIATIDQTVKHEKGEQDMSDKERFAGFDFSLNPYEQEARRRWGDKKVDEANAKLAGKQTFQDEMNAIYRDLAAIRHEDPASDIAQKRIKVWYDFLNKLGNYSLNAFAGLGQMYISDERFRENIDQFGEGLAAFMRDAMAVYARRSRG